MGGRGERTGGREGEIMNKEEGRLGKMHTKEQRTKEN